MGKSRAFRSEPLVNPPSSICKTYQSVTVTAGGKQVLLFGLPGNPVSTFLIFEVLVRALPCRLMGLGYQPRQVLVPLGRSLQRDCDHLEYLPVRLVGGRSGSSIMVLHT